MTLYHDPSAIGDRPNLVAGLMSLPSRLELEPMENQLTQTLAWVLDRDRELSRAFLCLFIEDSETRGRICSARAFAARTQVHLPGAGLASVLFPDLSVTTEGRGVQLLVEVKPGSGGFHDYAVEGIPVPQPEAYAWAWAQRPAGSEAAHRWVGTLTESYARNPELDAVLRGLPVKRARDITWQQVSDLMEALEGEERLEPTVRQVAQDFRAVLRERVILSDVLPPADQVSALLDRAHALLKAMKPRLARAGHKPRRAINTGPDYVGTYVDVPFLDGQLELWVQISPRGGRYALREEPDSLVVVVKRKEPFNGSDWSELFVPTGLRFGVDRAGYRGYRHTVPVEEIWAVGAENDSQSVDVAAEAIVDLVDRMRQLAAG